MGKRFASLNLVVGDVVSFDARVTEYTKGYRGRRDFEGDASPVEIDYRLSFPTKLTLLPHGSVVRELRELNEAVKGFSEVFLGGKQVVSQRHSPSCSQATLNDWCKQ